MQGFVPAYGGVDQRLRQIELHLRATPVGAGGEVKAAPVTVAVSGGASFSALEALDDVSLSVPASGDALIFDGTFWTNAATYVTTAPATSARNTVQASADATELILKGAVGQTAVILDVQNSGATSLLSVTPGGLATGQHLKATRAAAATPALTTYLAVTAAADTALSASVEATEVNLNLGRTVQWATGALVNQRSVKILAPTLAFVGASTVTAAATVYIDSAPLAGANATLTTSYALWVDAGLVRLDGNGTHVWEIGLSDTTALGAFYGRIPVSIPGVGTKYLPLYS